MGGGVRALACALVLPALLLALAGCGEEGAAVGAPAGYTDAVEDLCAESEPELADTRLELETAILAGDADEALDAATAYGALLEAQRDAAAAIEPADPEADGLHTDLVAGYDAALAATAELRAAIEAADGDAAEAAQAQFEGVAERQSEIAERLGAEDCAG